MLTATPVDDQPNSPPTPVSGAVPQSTSHRKEKKTVVITGYLMVKNIIAAKMSRVDDDHYFVVKLFHEATTSEMEVL